MCRKFIRLTSFVVMLGLAGSVSAVPNPVAWWKLDESSGTTASDLSGYGYNGTLVDGVTWMPTGGKFGGAASFGGGSQRIEFSTTGMSPWAGTVALWARPEGPQTQYYRYFFAVRDLPGGSNRVQLYLHRYTMQLGTGLGDAYDRNTNIQVLNTDTWYHIVLTWNGANWAVYVDNVQKASGTYTGLARMATGGDIGNDHQDRDKAFFGCIDDVGIWNIALSASDIESIYFCGIVAPGEATNPSPTNGTTDVPRDVVLSWTPGIYAPATSGHKVYLSENFNDVNDGIGGIVADANSYAPPQRLDLGTTYYWRVDEVNGAPDYTVFEGKVWSFTTEPVGYSIENVTATASSAQSADTGPENTVNGSGLDDSGLLHHDDDPGMWLSSAAGPQPTWIEFQFDKVYKLHEMWVWNSNGVSEPVIGFGFKDVSIEHSVNGTDYVALGTTYEFARAPGMDDYAHNTTIDLSGVTAKHVRLTANSNWGGLLNQYGLSEVRFFYIPVRARQPSPDSGAIDVDVEVTLGFRAGREAAKHDVYLSSDEQAVIDSTAPVTTVTETSYGPLSLDLAQTYYWKINEVNVAETPTTWESDLWSFATTEFLVVDDFESYNDLDPQDPESSRIFNTWIDGYEVPTNGSIVGCEWIWGCPEIVHEGQQSMLFNYDNSTASYSEAERTLSPPQDWTKHVVKALSLWFVGDPNNTPTQMYVKINGSKVAYDGDASNLTLAAWQPWNIDLAASGVNVTNVTKLAIGIDGNGAAGILFFDDIRLYPYDRQLTTPTEPEPANLVGHWKLDGNFDDSSGNGRHGTAMGNPTFVAGRIGQAISLDGLSDYVNITGYKGVLVDADNVQQPFTIACWFKTTSDGEMVTWGESDPAGHRMTFRVSEGRLRTEHGNGNIQGNINCNDGQWHHAAVTIARGAAISTPGTGLWLDGVFDLRASTDGDPDPYTLTAGADVSIGRRADNDSRYFIGAIDDVRIYDRALTEEEIAWLVGKTKPFDKPF